MVTIKNHFLTFESMKHTFTEENYLKTIYKLSRLTEGPVSTNAIAEVLNTKASSVTDMIKKLSDKELVNYQRYQGTTLTKEGEKIALLIIRKHRLWEYFLVNKLHFKWDEVHEAAEQLEHIHSEKLIERLDDFLGNPQYDPHGDPIPDKKGNIKHHPNTMLSDLKVHDNAIIVGVRNHSSDFLKYLETNKLLLGTELQVINKQEFDNSMLLLVLDQKIQISEQVSSNLFVKESSE